MCYFSARHTWSVNPRGLHPSAFWQMDVTHVSSFGKYSLCMFNADTYSQFTQASSHGRLQNIPHCLPEANDLRGNGKWCEKYKPYYGDKDVVKLWFQNWLTLGIVKMFELYILRGKLYAWQLHNGKALSVWELYLLYVCTTCMPAAHWSQKALDSLELELQVVAKWMLGIESRSSGRALNALNCWTVLLILKLLLLRAL